MTPETVRAPRTVEEALSLLAAGFAVIRSSPITPDENRRLTALIDSARKPAE